MRINGKTTLVDFTKDVVQSVILDTQGKLITTKLAANPNTYIYDCGVATIRKGYTDVTFIIGGASTIRTTASGYMSKSIYICYNPENTNTLKIIKLSQTLDEPAYNIGLTTVYDKYFNQHIIVGSRYTTDSSATVPLYDIYFNLAEEDIEKSI